jgi:hypothetical protein
LLLLADTRNIEGRMMTEDGLVETRHAILFTRQKNSVSQNLCRPCLMRPPRNRHCTISRVEINNAVIHHTKPWNPFYAIHLILGTACCYARAPSTYRPTTHTLPCSLPTPQARHRVLTPHKPLTPSELSVPSTPRIRLPARLTSRHPRPRHLHPVSTSQYNNTT